MNGATTMIMMTVLFPPLGNDSTTTTTPSIQNIRIDFYLPIKMARYLKKYPLY